MKKNKLFAFFLLCFLPISLFGNQMFLDIPESASVRNTLIEDWFTAHLDLLRGKNAENIQDKAGTTFQVRFEEYGNECAIIVAPEIKEKVETYTDAGVQTFYRSVYPQGARGSWTLFRDNITGKITCIRYHFSPNPEVYVQFRPSSFVGNNSEKSTADFVIFGFYAAKSVPVGLPIDRFFTLSFKEIFQITEKILPWDEQIFYPELYEDSIYMIGVIRDNLSRFHELEGAAYDEDGKPVFIKDSVPREELSSEDDEKPLYTCDAGFLKWVVDGLIRPISGSGLLLDPLKRDTLFPSETGYAYTVNEKYDIYFSLNWVRNLATAVASVFSGHDYVFETSGVEVKLVPFNNIYSSTAGYSITSLKPLMYNLAINEPGRFYLGAIRHTVKSEQGQEVSVYTECAVFFPLLDKNGKFVLVIFENGEELSFSEFVKKHENDTIQLTRILASSKFFPR